MDVLVHRVEIFLNYFVEIPTHLILLIITARLLPSSKPIYFIYHYYLLHYITSYSIWPITKFYIQPLKLPSYKIINTRVSKVQFSVFYDHLKIDFYYSRCHFSLYSTAIARVSLIDPGTDIDTLMGHTSIFLNILIRNTLTSKPTIGNLDRFQLESRISPVISISGGERKEK